MSEGKPSAFNSEELAQLTTSYKRGAGKALEVAIKLNFRTPKKWVAKIRGATNRIALDKVIHVPLVLLKPCLHY
jgi:hypothetical protein